MTSRPTIVLAEDHPQVAELLRKLLSESFDVLAVVAHGEALVRAADKWRPDIVVTDISMPGMDGITAAKVILGRQPSIGIVFVSVHDAPALARKALKIGLGYVLKNSAGEELIDAVNAAFGMRRFASPALGLADSLGD